MSFPRSWHFSVSLAPKPESLDRGLIAVRSYKAVATGNAKLGPLLVFRVSFLPNCSPHMRRMMPNATMEGNLSFWDLLAAETRLVVFIENIFPGHRAWWLTFSQAEIQSGARVTD